MWVTLLPDHEPDAHADMGIIVGPPDISSLGYSEDLTRRLHNALVERDILTWADFRRNRTLVLGALKDALRVDISALEGLYHEA